MIAHLADWIVSLPADQDSRQFFGWLLVLFFVALGLLLEPVVGKLCELTRWGLINNVPPKSVREAEAHVTAIHRDPPKPGTAAHGFTQVRRQQLDAIVQGQHAAKCVGYISPAEPYGRTRAEGWR